MNAKLQRQPTWLADSRTASGGRSPLILAWVFALSLNTTCAVLAAGDRGREIHLIGKSPTAFADLGRLGTEDDNGGYATQRGLPWAILLPDAWPWPAERTPVNEAHLEFVPWAESGGTEYTDWYLSKGNNRDPGKLISR